MIRKVEQKDIKECVDVIVKSFMTVADGFGFTINNAPRFTAFATVAELGCKKINIGIVEENNVLKEWYASQGFIHTGIQKFDFFPFTCGYMEKNI